MKGTEILLENALPRRPARWRQPASIDADAASAGCCCADGAKMPALRQRNDALRRNFSCKCLDASGGGAIHTNLEPYRQESRPTWRYA